LQRNLTTIQAAYRAKTMQGITRIKITETPDRLKNNIDKVKNAEPNINRLYREILPLADGDVTLETTMQELEGTYDYCEGIDVILRLKDGSKLTLQEKILTLGFNTITVEECKHNGKQGAWYYCSAQLYFCCEKDKNDQIINYVLVDFARLKILTNQGKIDWKYRVGKIGEANQFRYIPLADIPKECLIASRLPSVAPSKSMLAPCPVYQEPAKHVVNHIGKRNNKVEPTAFKQFSLLDD